VIQPIPDLKKKWLVCTGSFFFFFKKVYLGFIREIFLLAKIRSPPIRRAPVFLLFIFWRFDINCCSFRLLNGLDLQFRVLNGLQLSFH
jgi:hypothetical protein